MRSFRGEDTWEPSPRGWNAQAGEEDLERPKVQEIRKERGERCWASPRGAWAASSFSLCLCSGSPLDINSITTSHTVDTCKFLLNDREYVLFICVSPVHSIVPDHGYCMNE